MYSASDVVAQYSFASGAESCPDFRNPGKHGFIDTSDAPLPLQRTDQRDGVTVPPGRHRPGDGGGQNRRTFVFVALFQLFASRSGELHTSEVEVAELDVVPKHLAIGPTAPPLSSPCRLVPQEIRSYASRAQTTR